MSHRELQIQRGAGLWPLSWPMGLTMLRLLLLPVFLWVLLIDASGSEGARPHRWWAVGIFAVMAITDKLDGYLARRLNQTSKLGTILDPVADKLLVACSVILLSFGWIATPGFQIPVWVVVAVYGKDLIVALGTIALLAVAGRVRIKPRMLGKLSTFLQLSLVMATLMGPDLEKWHAEFAWYLLRRLWWGVSVVAAAACGDYLVQGFKQFGEMRRTDH